MKKRLTAAAAAIMILLLAAGCGQDKGELVDEYVYRYSSVGEIIDKGSIKAVCPTGWTSLDAYDFEEKADEAQTDEMVFVKGGSSLGENRPYIRIIRHLPEEGWTAPRQDLYEEPSEITPVTAGNRTWKGFSASVDGHRFIWASAYGEDYALEAWLWPQADSEVSANISDADVEKILESVVVTVPEKKGR